jgi:hypothetical protein
MTHIKAGDVMVDDERLYAPVGKGAEAILAAATPGFWYFYSRDFSYGSNPDFPYAPPFLGRERLPKRIELYFAREIPYNTGTDPGICGPLPFLPCGKEGKYLTYSSTPGGLLLAASFHLDILMLTFRFLLPSLGFGPSVSRFGFAQVSIPKLPLLQLWFTFRTPDEVAEPPLPLDDHIFPEYQRRIL